MDKIDYFGTGEDAGDNSFLSNFYWFDYPDLRKTYFQDGSNSGTRTTVEHLYQCAKTTDPVYRAQILEAKTPGEAKKIGRRAPLRPDWEDVKISVMYELLQIKFASGTELAEKLLATGEAYLEEGNWWNDKFWGTVLGEGENWLGRLLMMVRGSLRVERDHGLR